VYLAVALWRLLLQASWRPFQLAGGAYSRRYLSFRFVI
jgi:hypothetical protein